MLFNSFEFIVFAVIVFLLYWFVFSKNIKAQNIFVILTSYFFYGWWNWKFLFLIAGSSIVDYFVGEKIFQAQGKNQKRRWLLISLLCNLGALAIFKYFNFFIDSFINLINLVGLQANPYTLQIILPVGISFYTFQTLSYSIDIYRGKLEPTKDIVSFFAFVSFFPQLVAGPIERAKDLLPQFQVERKFDYVFAADGMRQMLWGFFKKIVIADGCAVFVNEVFANYAQYSSPTLVLGGIFFAIQVYADFSGYSDIAIGLAKQFGFKLNVNFKNPYFSTNWGEFWKRWHISLSSWILDYVFQPLAVEKRSWGNFGIVFALMVTFTLNGLWHGANWTYVVFGFFLGLFISVEFLLKKTRNRIKRSIGKPLHNFGGWMHFVILWILACILFRSEGMAHAGDYFARLFSMDFASINKFVTTSLALLIGVMFLLEWYSRDRDHGLQIDHLGKTMRWVAYPLIGAAIIVFGTFNSNEFIYFQF